MRNQPSLFGNSDPAPFQQQPAGRESRKNVGILSLDIATKTGWCIHDRSGTWDFTPKQGENEAARLFRFRARIDNVLKTGEIKRVIFELPLIYKSKKRRPNFISYEMIGVLKLICIDYRIPFKGYQAMKLKKWATGNGAAKKEDMVSFCKARYGITPGDHNQADAIHLYHMAIEDLQL